MLDYEKLDVYQAALEFLALVVDILDELPRGHGHLGDQLRRASLSISLNIAEGSGKVTGPDRARFSAISRGSAMECGAIFDVLRIQKLIPASQFEQGKRLVTRMVCMLSKMRG